MDHLRSSGYGTTVFGMPATLAVFPVDRVPLHPT